MTDIDALAGRIDAEFSSFADKTKHARAEQEQAYLERERRMARLGQVFEELREVWKPKLEVLLKKFGDRAAVTPRIVPATREATFSFDSKMAQIRLKLSASTDRDVTKVILGYDLSIIPVLMRFDGHSELEFTLDAVDKAAAAAWIDDRIVSFVKTYLALHEQDQYLKDQMVEDPVAGVRFPKFAAGATLEWKGQTYYFVGEETRKEFEKKQGVGSK